jgi:hypothetical protein
VAAFFAGFLCVVAAASLNIGRAENQRESASQHGQQFDALHLSFLGVMSTGVLEQLTCPARLMPKRFGLFEVE